MNSKLLVLLAIITVFAFTQAAFSHAALTFYNNTTPTVDGYVSGIGVKTDGGTTLKIRTEGGGTNYRAYIEIPVNTIPNNATILNVRLNVHGTGANTNLVEVHAMANQPSTTGGAAVYTDCADGTKYTEFTLTTTGHFSLDLGAQACTDLQANLAAADWFAVGFYTAVDIATSKDLISSEGAAGPPVNLHETPAIAVQYSYKGIYYTFNSKFENNTNYYPAEIQVVSSDGTTIIHLHAQTSYGFSLQPTAVTWITAAPAFDSRYIYLTTPTGTFTRYEPTGTTYGYEFTVKDYASKLQGSCYLEAYTGATLNQRMPIIAGNPVPFDLTFNRSYDIQVLFSDGTRYDWGLFLAGSTLTHTIILRGVTFDKQAYTASQFITIEATRSGGTVTVDYLDLQNGTVWANVTIRIRNGAVVATSNSNLDSFTYNYAGVATTSYVVSIIGNNTYLPVWGYTKILDATPTFPSLPSLTGIFTFGGVSLTYAVGLGMSIFGFAIFSVAFKRQGMMLGWALTALLTYVNATGLSYELLAFIGFISLIVAATGGQEG